MISELKVVTIGVSNLDRSISFYREAFRYDVLGTGVLEGGPQDTFNGTWSENRNLSANFAVIGVPTIASGLMRLVEFGSDAEQIWGGYERPGDHGLYAINYRVPDLAAAWPRIVDAGTLARSEPHFWKVSDALSVHDCMCFDPDGTLLDVFEIVATGPTIHKDLTLPASEVQNVVVHSANADVCRDFYCGTGFTVNQDKTLEGLEEFLKLPKGTALRNLNLAMNRLTPNGRIEISEYVGIEGRRVNAAPSALGILSISFQCDDFEAGCARFASLGAGPVGDPYATLLPPFGKVRARLFEGPDGERLELFSQI